MKDKNTDYSVKDDDSVKNDRGDSIKTMICESSEQDDCDSPRGMINDIDEPMTTDASLCDFNGADANDMNTDAALADAVRIMVLACKAPVSCRVKGTHKVGETPGRTSQDHDDAGCHNAVYRT